MPEPLVAVILTGPSCSGKSSVAIALRSQLPEIWLHVPIDAFLEMPDMAHPKLRSKPMTTLASSGFFSGVVAAWGSLVDHGNRLIIDVVANELLLDDCARVFRGRRVMIVYLTTDVAVLEARERDRRDRPAGQARAQSEYMERRVRGGQDLLIDTADRSVDDIAREVANAMAFPPDVLTLELWGQKD